MEKYIAKRVRCRLNKVCLSCVVFLFSFVPYATPLTRPTIISFYSCQSSFCHDWSLRRRFRSLFVKRHGQVIGRLRIWLAIEETSMFSTILLLIDLLNCSEVLTNIFNKIFFFNHRHLTRWNGLSPGCQSE